MSPNVSFRNYRLLLAFCALSFSVFGNAQIESDSVRFRMLDDKIWNQYIGFDCDSALILSEDLVLIAENMSDTVRLVTALNTFGTVYRECGDIEKALQIHQKALSLSEIARNDNGKAVAAQNIGSAYYLLGQFAEAEKFYSKAVGLFIIQKKYQKLAGALSNLGMTQQLLDKQQESAKNLFWAIKIAMHYDDKTTIAEAYGNLGIQSAYLGDNATALKYFNISLHVFRDVGYKVQEATTHEHIGVVLDKMNRPNEALKRFELARGILTQINYHHGLNGVLTNMGGIYAKMGYPDSAKHCFEEALQLARQNNLKSSEWITMVNYYDLLLQLKPGPAVLDSIKRLCSEVERSDNLNIIKESQLLLFKAFKANGLISEALPVYENYIALRDSLESNEKRKDVMRQQMNFEFVQKEKQIRAEQEKKEAVTKVELKKKNLQRNAFIGGFLLMLALALVIFRSLVNGRKQNRIITMQKEEVETKNHEILQSIAYARKLQDAVLPPPRVVKEFFAESYLLYLPKDIVSGDFYWMENRGSVSFFAVGDCTGHGVPGAMLSVIGLNGLNRCLNEMNITSPAAILEQLTLIFHSSFERSEATVRDGMDISICAMDNETGTLTFAGANNMLRIVREGQILEYKGDKRAVGFHDANVQFSEVQIALKKGDILLLSTDGFADQFGGPEGKKFLNKRLRELFVSLESEPMWKQRSSLLSAFEQWRGNGEQTDDVCVLGVRI